MSSTVPGDVVITVSNLTQRYGAVAAVDDVSFVVRRGAILGLLGPRGSGKTTTLNALLGLLVPTSGDARIEGRRSRDLPEPRQVVGTNVGWTTVGLRGTARSYLRSMAGAMGQPPAVDAALDQAGLMEVADLRISRLPRSMRQRLGLAGALLGEPAVLVLDEPADGLDASWLRWLHTTVRDFAGRGGTVLLTSPLPRHVAETVDEIVVLRGGRVVLRSAVGALLEGAARTASVRVHTPHAGLLAAALAGQGHACLHLGAGVVRVHDLAADELRALASAADVAIDDLREETPGLEATYLALVSAEPAGVCGAPGLET